MFYLAPPGCGVLEHFYCYNCANCRFIVTLYMPESLHRPSHVQSLTPLYTAPVIAYRRGVPICVLTHVSIKCVLPRAGRIFSHTIGDAAHAPQRRACLLSPYGFTPVALRVGLSVV